MHRVGLEAYLIDNVSSGASGIAESLKDIGDAGEEAGRKIEQAFSEADLERVAKLMKVFQNEKSSDERRLKLEHQELQNQVLKNRIEREENAKEAPTKKWGSSVIDFPTSFPGKALGAIAHAGAGDPIGATAEGLQSLSKPLGFLGPAGMAAGTTLAGLGGVAIGADAIIRQWEKLSEPSMKLAAALGDLGTDTTKYSKKFQEALDSAGSSATKFGFTLEEGLETATLLAREGVTGGMNRTSRENIFRYALGSGADRGFLTQAEGAARRFGGETELLRKGWEGTQYSGLGVGQYEEFLRGTLSIFEEGLSRGITRGFDTVLDSQVFFSQAGKLWQGEQGAQKLASLNQSVSSATSLQKETDFFLYQATRDTFGKGTDPRYTDILMKMEKGIDEDIFRGVGERIERYTGGDRDAMIKLFRSTFGTNYTMAGELVDLFKTGISTDEQKEKLKGMIQGLPDPTGTPEVQVKKLVEDIRGNVVSIAANIIDAKRGILKIAYGATEGISGFVDNRTDSAEAQKRDLEVTKAMGETFSGTVGKNGAGQVGRSALLGFNFERWEDVQRVYQLALKEGKLSDAERLMDTFRKLTPIQEARASADGMFLETAIRSIGNKNRELEVFEIPDFIEQVMNYFKTPVQRKYEEQKQKEDDIEALKRAAGKPISQAETENLITAIKNLATEFKRFSDQGNGDVAVFLKAGHDSWGGT